MKYWTMKDIINFLDTRRNNYQVIGMFNDESGNPLFRNSIER